MELVKGEVLITKRSYYTHPSYRLFNVHSSWCYLIKWLKRDKCCQTSMTSHSWSWLVSELSSTNEPIKSGKFSWRLKLLKMRYSSSCSAMLSDRFSSTLTTTLVPSTRHQINQLNSSKIHSTTQLYWIYLNNKYIYKFKSHFSFIKI